MTKLLALFAAFTLHIPAQAEQTTPVPAQVQQPIAELTNPAQVQRPIAEPSAVSCLENAIAGRVLPREPKARRIALAAAGLITPIVLLDNAKRGGSKIVHTDAGARVGGAALGLLFGSTAYFAGKEWDKKSHSSSLQRAEEVRLILNDAYNVTRDRDYATRNGQSSEFFSKYPKYSEFLSYYQKPLNRLATEHNVSSNHALVFADAMIEGFYLSNPCYTRQSLDNRPTLYNFLQKGMADAVRKQ